MNMRNRQQLVKNLSAAVSARRAVHKTQDPKYSIQDNRIIDTYSGAAIPMCEPVFILRAKDINSLTALRLYRDRCANSEHRTAVKQRVEEFKAFAAANKDIMKEPDTNAGLLDISDDDILPEFKAMKEELAAARACIDLMLKLPQHVANHEAIAFLTKFPAKP